MSRGTKLDLRPVIRGHLRALAGKSGRLGLRDKAEQFGMPIVIGALAGLAGVTVSTTTAAALLTLSGIFAAFFFQLSVQLLDRAGGWSEGAPPSGRETSDYARMLGALSASTTYAALVAAACAVAALAVSISESGWPERVLAAVVIGMISHLGTTLVLVTVRVYLLTQSRLNQARGGRDRTL